MPKRNRARELRRAGSESAPPEHDRSRPPSDVVKVSTQDEARALAAHLLAAERAWPVAVVTTAADVGHPLVDVEALSADVGDLAEVVLLPTGAASWAFSEQMPPLTQVYGGASRVYATGLDWVDDPYRSRLRFAYTASDGGKVRELLVHDVLSAAARAGLIGGASATASGGSRRTGRVRGVVGPRAVVDLDDGGQAAVAEELTGAGVPLAQVLAPGQRVTGTLDPTTRLLAVELPDDAGSRRIVTGAYRPGDVVLVRVRDAERDSVTVELAPQVACRVPRQRVTGNDLDSLDDLFSPGEVVLARVVPAPGGLAVRLDDVDDIDDHPVPAVAVLPGGPPWLLFPSADPAPAETVAAQLPASPALPPASEQVEPAPEEPATPSSEPPSGPSPALLAARARGEHVPTPAPPHPAEAPPSGPTRVHEAAVAPSRKALQDALLALAEARGRAEIVEREALAHDRRATQLAADNRHLLAEIEHLRSRLERLENQVREQKKKYRVADLRRQQAVRGTAPAEDDGPWFTDPAEQFRHDVYQAWVHTVAAAEKPSLPLGDYVLGPRFLASLDAVEGVSRRKVAETVVHVVTGRASSINGLQLHRLRSAETGNAPQRTRDDGAACWRVSLQVNTPSARRLHFWRLPDGSVELSRVVLHDDVEP